MDNKKLIAAGICTTAIIIILIFISSVKSDKPNRSINTDSLPQSSKMTVLPDCPIDFAALKAENSDICGWISLPAAGIDFPVLQSSDTKEDFYLDHDTDRKYKFAGSIYIQKMNSNAFTDRNTVIYGHNMRNGTMFGSLKKYRDATFFNQNDEIRIFTPGHILTYKIFSAFIYDDRHIPTSFNFDSPEGLKLFLDDCINPKSRIKNVRQDFSVSENARIITLSTCAAKDAERYLVCAVLTGNQLCK